MAFSFVTCIYCSKHFLKDNRHINENIRLNHNFYCSIKCQSSYKNKQKECKCENSRCNNKFMRQLKDISARNFCSQKCAMEVIGPENGLKHRILNYCIQCSKIISSRKKYCSSHCWGLAHKIGKDTLIEDLQQFAKIFGRSPTKREFRSNNSCVRYFGSWNKALIESGLIPNRSLNQRMYRRRRCIANDGHICNSISELLIDNWLTESKINHIKEAAYPVGNYKADWMIGENILVEYFGLAFDSRRYDIDRLQKKRLCQKYDIKLIEIYSKDIFPRMKLDRFFNQFNNHNILL